MSASLLALSTGTVHQRVHWSERVAHAALALVVLALLVFLAAPLAAILMQSVEGHDGEFVGLRNFIAYARTPALLDSLWNSVWVSAAVTVITIPLAFGFAYALTRSCISRAALLVKVIAAMFDGFRPQSLMR